MKNNALQQIARGMDACPIAKDHAISALVMRTVAPPMDDCDQAYTYGAHSSEEDSPFLFVRSIRAGRDMRLHI